MRVALLYPPPWKMPLPGERPDPIDGPPEGHAPGDLDGDFFQTPYGLFTLGAQAIRAGHQVKVYNLSAFAWSAVDAVIEALDADVVGMSCWTANRRGVALVAELVKQKHPHAFVVVGGPHATPLAKEMLAHHRAIDLVTLGESEETFMELLDRIEKKAPTTGLAGSVWRAAGTSKIVEGPERPSIKKLDALASPHDWFDTHIVMTSRGCPWACTFCGADTTWGRGFRGNSVPYVIDSLASAVERLPVKMVQIKDDTFTTNKKRVLELCRGLRARDVRFAWSCDTRVDVVDDELLEEMRLAGCERLSLGVESGSQRVLDLIDKKITVDEIVASTELAKKWGIKVRYYMMLGNRGETAESFRETLAFLERARPHQYLFSCLSIYPGTRDFHDAEAAGWLDREVYFTEKFQELKTPFDASEEDTATMAAWFEKNKGLRVMFEESVDDYAAILARLPDHAAAHVDLAGALVREKRFDEAEPHLRRALDLGYPLPGVVYSYLASVAHGRGDLERMSAHLSAGIALDPQHPLLLQNHVAALAWLASDRSKPLVLAAKHGFDLIERTIQPTLPGPLPDDFAEWKPVARPKPIAPIRPEELVSRAGGMRKLAVVG